MLFNSHIISMQLKWGILSAGRISNDFVAALKTLPKEHHQVVAVAAREGKYAEDFAKLHSIPKFYGGYENLFTDEKVQIIYIGKPDIRTYVYYLKGVYANVSSLCPPNRYSTVE